MKGRVFKYRIDPKKAKFSVPIQKGAMVLTAQMQENPRERGEQPVMWALVDADAPFETRDFVLLETGEIFDFPGMIRFIQTLQFNRGRYVLHLFEIT